MKATIAIDQSEIIESGLTSEQFQEAAINALSTLNCPITGNPIYFNGVQVFVDAENQSTSIQSGTTHFEIESKKQEMTESEMKKRINVLANEIDANEQENQLIQNEIDSLYAKIDALKVVTA